MFASETAAINAGKDTIHNIHNSKLAEYTGYSLSLNADQQ